jgi:hypothetical protein
MDALQLPRLSAFRKAADALFLSGYEWGVLVPLWNQLNISDRRYTDRDSETL